MNASSSQRRARLAVVTINDSLQHGESGQYLQQVIEQAGHQVIETVVVPNDAVAIRTHLVKLLREADIVITTGGTSLTGRNVAIPVVESLLTKPIAGFGQLFRMLSYTQIRGSAMIAQAMGGMTRGGLLFALPGNIQAVKVAWEGILSEQIQDLICMVPIPEDKPLGTPVSTPVMPTDLNPKPTHTSIGRHAGVAATPSTAPSTGTETALGRHAPRR